MKKAISFIPRNNLSNIFKNNDMNIETAKQNYISPEKMLQVCHFVESSKWHFEVDETQD